MRGAWALVVLACAVACACGGGGGAPGTPDANVEAWLDRPLRDQVAAIEHGDVTGAQLEAGYRARVDERDPKVHSILIVDPQAGALAAALDGQRGTGAPLQGAVIVVKDNIDTQALATTAGSLALAMNEPARDAFVVDRLHAAHALVLAKTNLSEWANFRSTGSISGWSSVGGQTYNGTHEGYSPCGSSAGSAAAVAAGLASAALGTETDGSIVCPSSVNGVVGFKPTVGLVSRAGVVPISATQDTVGPITRTVGDAARVLGAIAGPDAADPATATIPAGMSLDFESGLAGASLAGKRFGVVDFGYGASVDAVFATARARMEAAGAIFVDVTLTDTWSSDEFTVLLYEFKDGVNAYLAAHPVAGQPATLADLIAYDTAHAATVMPYFGQEIFTQAEATTGLATAAYVSAKQRAHDAAGPNGIDAVMTANQLDALVAPTADPAWKVDLANGDPSIRTSSSPAATAGYPHLTVPMGAVGGLPVGLSFFGHRWDDGKLLALGYAFEQLAP